MEQYRPKSYTRLSAAGFVLRPGRRYRITTVDREFDAVLDGYCVNVLGATNLTFQPYFEAPEFVDQVMPELLGGHTVLLDRKATRTERPVTLALQEITRVVPL